MDNKSLSHTRWKCQYHIVFIPKYRKKVLYGRIRRDVREIIATLCQYKNVEIIAGAVCIDHVHLSVAIPPKLRVSDFMGYLKGKSTYRFIAGQQKCLRYLPLGRAVTIALWRANNKPPVELVVANLNVLSHGKTVNGRIRVPFYSLQVMP